MNFQSLLCLVERMSAVDGKYVIGSATKLCTKIVSEFDQEIPQSQTADIPVAPRGRAAQPSRDTRITN